jgi:thioesterase domain-containing protein/acyl carrier protein
LTLAELLAAIRTAGIELEVQGDRLKCRAPTGALTPTLSDAIREHKAELMRMLADSAANASASAEPIMRQGERDRYPLSFTQARIAITEKPGAGLPTAFRLVGPLDRAALEKALRTIVQRHAPLRSRFELECDEPAQRVSPDASVPVGFTDLESLDEGPRKIRLDELLAEQLAHRFDIARGPLFRFHLIRLGANEHVLFCAFSSLCFDGWSFDVFWNELRAGYAALSRDEPWPFPGLEVEYADFVAWQRQQLVARQAELTKFWRGHLGSELPPPALPTPPPTAASSPEAGQFAARLSSDTEALVRSYARAANLTPQIVMLGALFVFLARIGATRDIVIATPVDARIHPGIEPLIGPVVNLLLLREKVELERCFSHFVATMRDRSLAAYDHQDLPTQLLQVRSGRDAHGRAAPVFQVEFSYQQVSQRGSHMGSVSLTQLDLASGATTNGLMFWAKDWGNRIGLYVEHRLDLFPAALARHWADAYLVLLRGLVTDPGQPMDTVPLLDEQGRKAVTSLISDPRRLPSWAEDAESRDALGRLRIVDAHGVLQPLGAIGQLEFEVEGSPPRRLDVRGFMFPDGSITPWPESSQQVASAPSGSEKEPPQSELEKQLVGLYAELLGCDRAEVGVEDHFFDLGGNSLLAVRLFAELQRRFGTRLPVTTIVNAGTPRALGKHLAGLYASEESCLVELRAGTGQRRLFLVHDADGEVLLYLHLARRMPADVSVYGVIPRGAKRIPIVHARIEQMAAAYVAELRAKQPEGPYHLGGLCAGGLIAFEMARQLEAAGQEVQLLALMEAAPPKARKRESVKTPRLRRLFADADSSNVLRTAAERGGNFLRYEAARLLGGLRNRALYFGLRHRPSGADWWPDSLPVLSVREVFARAEAAYEPRPLGQARALLVRATHGDGSDRHYRDWLVDEHFDWGPYLPAPIAVADIPGGHSSMFREPHVEHMADALAAALVPIGKDEACRH